MWAERRGDPTEQAASSYMGMSRVHYDAIPTAYYLFAAYKVVEPLQSTLVCFYLRVLFERNEIPKTEDAI
jgi:hypothetical protein